MEATEPLPFKSPLRMVGVSIHQFPLSGHPVPADLQIGDPDLRASPFNPADIASMELLEAMGSWPAFWVTLASFLLSRFHSHSGGHMPFTLWRAYAIHTLEDIRHSHFGGHMSCSFSQKGTDPWLS